MAKPQIHPTMKTSTTTLIALASSILLAASSNTLLAAEIEKPAPPSSTPSTPAETRELLSSHDTEAIFEGVTYMPCRHLTSLCPDRCGHGANVARFRITKYLDYKKPGKYGDEQAKVFLCRVSNGKGDDMESSIRQETLDALALKPGDAVRLSWNHDYVKREGSQFPMRPITRLEKLPTPSTPPAPAPATPPDSTPSMPRSPGTAR